MRDIIKYSFYGACITFWVALTKNKQNFDFEGLCKGLLDSPLRIRLS